MNTTQETSTDIPITQAQVGDQIITRRDLEDIACGAGQIIAVIGADSNSITGQFYQSGAGLVECNFPRNTTTNTVAWLHGNNRPKTWPV